MSDFGYSDLTDMDEEPEIPLSQASPSKKGKNRSATPPLVHGALSIPRTANYSAEALYVQMINGDIDLCPVYQRGVVWPESKQMGVIDSLFRNYYIPPIIFEAVKQESDGSQKRVCIDGKQRLSSVQKFMDGLIYCNYHLSVLVFTLFANRFLGEFHPDREEKTNHRYYYKSNAGKKAGKVLPDRYKHIFRNKTFVCVEYDGITEDEEREIFQRVQMGMALTPAERIQALSAPRANFVRDLLPEFILDDGLAGRLEWDTARAADFRGVCTAIWLNDNWPSKTPPGLPTLTKWLSQKQDFSEDAKQDYRQTFAIFLELTNQEEHSKVFRLAGVKKVAPVEIIAIVCLISRFKHKMNLAKLSESIGAMRLDVREHETDIRTNNRCMKALTTFIERLKVPKLNGPPATKQVRVPAPSQKRKRVDTDESGSDNATSDEDTYVEKKPPKKAAKAGASKKAVKAEPRAKEEQLPTPSSTTAHESDNAMSISRPPSRARSPPRAPAAQARPMPISTRLQAIRLAKDTATATAPPIQTHYNDPPPPQPQPPVQQQRYPSQSQSPYDQQPPPLHEQQQQPSQYDPRPPYQPQHSPPPQPSYYPPQSQPQHYSHSQRPPPPPSQYPPYRQANPPNPQHAGVGSLLSRVGPPPQEPSSSRYATGANAYPGRPAPRGPHDGWSQQRRGSGSSQYGDGWR